MTMVGFEGLAGSDGIVTIADGYAGFDWTNAGALSKQFVDVHHPISGYHNVLHKKDVAYLYGDDGDTGNSGFALAEGTFTFKSGIFASAWDTGDQVTFTALRDGSVVGSKHAVLDETATEITFGKHFRHIDEVQITWTQGTPVDPSEGFGPYLAADNLMIVFDSAPTAVDHSIPHAADWMFA